MTNDERVAALKAAKTALECWPMETSAVRQTWVNAALATVGLVLTAAEESRDLETNTVLHNARFECPCCGTVVERGQRAWVNAGEAMDAAHFGVNDLTPRHCCRGCYESETTAEG